MCLDNFERFEIISKDNPIVGYRNFLVEIKNPIILKSIYMNYNWSKNEGPHPVLNSNSGIYSYKNYYNYNNSYKNYYNYNNYYISGIIVQWGKVAIHSEGYRSEYAKVKTLLTIRELDAKVDDKFKEWIGEFNQIVNKLAVKYEVNTIHWQDFNESKSNEVVK